VDGVGEAGREPRVRLKPDATHGPPCGDLETRRRFAARCALRSRRSPRLLLVRDRYCRPPVSGVIAAPIARLNAGTSRSIRFL
jgi:hypothetical protein